MCALIFRSLSYLPFYGRWNYTKITRIAPTSNHFTVRSFSEPATKLTMRMVSNANIFVSCKNHLNSVECKLISTSKEHHPLNMCVGVLLLLLLGEYERVKHSSNRQCQMRGCCQLALANANKTNTHHHLHRRRRRGRGRTS